MSVSDTGFEAAPRVNAIRLEIVSSLCPFGKSAEAPGWGMYRRRMARPLRNFGVGIYHIAAHGSDTRHLFLTDRDRDDFLDRLTLSFFPLKIRLLDYVLMGNHYHALVHTPDARLSDALQRLHTGYSRRHNRRHGRSAHLFRAHCSTRAVMTERQLLATYRYIARNPVRANLVLDPLDWPWGSARAHAGLDSPAIPLDERPLRAAFGNAPNWRRRYRRLIQREGDEEDLEAMEAACLAA
jgi:REP element-mobilizing transposase RayT